MAMAAGAKKEEAADESSGPIIGIDLGTTYSCVGIYRNGRVEIIPNDQGNRITPSYVAWEGEERLVGDAAKNQATINPTNTVFDVKRLIGRNFNDETVQHDMKLWPFKVRAASSGRRPLSRHHFRWPCWTPRGARCDPLPPATTLHPSPANPRRW